MKPSSKPRSLRKEITAILIVKLILIVTIKLAFFSDARKPGSEGAAAAILATQPTDISSPSVAIRSSAHE
jgi:hypothetical protein